MQSHRETGETWAERLYGALLWLYPERHRQAYGFLMTQLFLDQLRDARLVGKWSILALWLRTAVDVLATAPGEHMKGVFTDPNKPLLSWRGAMLMIVPALLLLSGWLPVTGVIETTLYIITVPISLAILSAALVVWKRTQRIPIWGMPLLGMLMTMLVWVLTTLPNTIVSDLFSSGGSLSGFEQALLNFTIVLAYALRWAIIIGLFVYYARRQPVSRSAWAMLGVYVFVTISVSAISVVVNRAVMSDNLLNILLNVLSSFSFLFLLLFPVALGLLLAHRQSVEALLFAVSGMTFFHQFIDVDYHFAFTYGNTPMVALYNILWRILVFVIAPLWMVRVQSNRGRLVGITIPILAAVVVEVIVNNVGYPLASPSSWIWSFAVALAQPMLAISVAYMFYCHGGESHAHGITNATELVVEPNG